MGVDIHSIRQVIHIDPPRTIREYFQETGRVGRDGQPSKAILYYNNRDVAKNKPGLQEEIRMYCQSKNQCLQSFGTLNIQYHFLQDTYAAVRAKTLVCVLSAV